MHLQRFNIHSIDVGFSVNIKMVPCKTTWIYLDIYLTRCTHYGINVYSFSDSYSWSSTVTATLSYDALAGFHKEPIQSYQLIDIQPCCLTYTHQSCQSTLASTSLVPKPWTRVWWHAIEFCSSDHRKVRSLITDSRQ